jgi:uncharacterized membrane protein
MEKHMSLRKALLAIAVVAVAAAIFAPVEASARRRGGYAMSPDYYDRVYCGRLPAYGYDGCGYPEFGYGPDSCFRRVIANSPTGPRPRRVYVCG